MSEDAGFVPNGNRDAPISGGMNGAKVEHKLNQHDGNNMVDSATPFFGNNHDLKPHISQQPVTVLHNVAWPTAPRTLVPLQKPSFPGVSVRREVNPSELYPESGRRILMMPHGQDVREFGLGDSSILSKPLVHVAVPSVQSRGGWLVEEDPNVGPSNQTLRQVQDAGTSNPDKQRGYHHSVVNSFPFGTLPSLPQVKNEQEFLGHKRQKRNDPLPNVPNQSLPSEHNGINLNQVSIITRENETGKVFPPSMPVGVLQEIGRRCGFKYKFDVSTSKDLQIFVEVLFGGERMGVGKGKTRKDAQQQATENSLRNLAANGNSHLMKLSNNANKYVTSKLSYKFDVSTSKDLQIFVEVLFGGERMGVGKGKTRKDAQQQAAENALRSLADKYVAHIAPDSGAMHKDLDTLSLSQKEKSIFMGCCGSS